MIITSLAFLIGSLTQGSNCEFAVDTNEVSTLVWDLYERFPDEEIVTAVTEILSDAYGLEKFERNSDNEFCGVGYAACIAPPPGRRPIEESKPERERDLKQREECRLPNREIEREKVREPVNSRTPIQRTRPSSGDPTHYIPQSWITCYKAKESAKAECMTARCGRLPLASKERAQCQIACTSLAWTGFLTCLARNIRH